MQCLNQIIASENFPALLWCVAIAAVGILLFLWCVIALAGAVPVMTLHKVRLRPVSDARAREILAKVLSTHLDMDVDRLNAVGFSPIGVFTAKGLMGSPEVTAWERQGQATWLCGYLLPDGTCQLDFVSRLGESTLTTGTSKDGHLFPTAQGKFVQTFDSNSMSDLLQHHERAAEFLSATLGLQIDRDGSDFAQSFVDSLKAEGETIRSMFLWPARIPWWYFTRRGSRHNRTVGQLYG